MKKLWANVLVKNEDRYLWFAIMSVIEHVDKVLVWDTGSYDQTIFIIEELQKKYPQKIIYAKKGLHSPEGVSKLRQEMLEASLSDWILILDGDEVWWKDSLEEIHKIINNSNNNLYALVNPTINLIGDIYHYQPAEAGQYQILGKKGHLNIRFINKRTPGLHVSGIYPNEGFYNSDNILIQNLDSHLKYVDLPLLHFTHLARSTKFNNPKQKYELGKTFPSTFKYPESLNQNRPVFVISPWKTRTKGYIMRAGFETPLKKLKRRAVKVKLKILK